MDAWLDAVFSKTGQRLCFLSVILLMVKLSSQPASQPAHGTACHARRRTASARDMAYVDARGDRDAAAVVELTCTHMSDGRSEKPQAPFKPRACQPPLLQYRIVVAAPLTDEGGPTCHDIRIIPLRPAQATIQDRKSVTGLIQNRRREDEDSVGSESVRETLSLQTKPGTAVTMGCTGKEWSYPRSQARECAGSNALHLGRLPALTHLLTSGRPPRQRPSP